MFTRPYRTSMIHNYESNKSVNKVEWILTCNMFKKTPIKCKINVREWEIEVHKSWEWVTARLNWHGVGWTEGNFSTISDPTLSVNLWIHWRSLFLRDLTLAERSVPSSMITFCTVSNVYLGSFGYLLGNFSPFTRTVLTSELRHTTKNIIKPPNPSTYGLKHRSVQRGK